MAKLSENKCEVCRADAPMLDGAELESLLPQIPGWNVIEVNGINQLQKAFSFKNYTKALAFTNAIAELAESEGHHPAILLEWGKVTVEWWTHKIKGLHKNDVVMAAKTNDLFADE